MNTFAERLKYAMEQADLKQSALSDRAGISMHSSPENYHTKGMNETSEAIP